MKSILAPVWNAELLHKSVCMAVAQQSTQYNPYKHLSYYNVIINCCKILSKIHDFLLVCLPFFTLHMIYKHELHVSSMATEDTCSPGMVNHSEIFTAIKHYFYNVRIS
jgi:hypothetical protein